MNEIPNEAIPNEQQVTDIVFRTQRSRIFEAATYAWHARDGEVAELQAGLAESDVDLRVAQLQKELDAALARIVELVEAWEYREDWEARNAETSQCGKCSWDSGPYTIECEEHNPDTPMKAAIAAVKQNDTYCRVK